MTRDSWPVLYNLLPQKKEEKEQEQFKKFFFD